MRKLEQSISFSLNHYIFLEGMESTCTCTHIIIHVSHISCKETGAKRSLTAVKETSWWHYKRSVITGNVAGLCGKAIYGHVIHIIHDISCVLCTRVRIQLIEP